VGVLEKVGTGLAREAIFRHHASPVTG